MMSFPPTNGDVDRRPSHSLITREEVRRRSPTRLESEVSVRMIELGSERRNMEARPGFEPG